MIMIQWHKDREGRSWRWRRSSCTPLVYYSSSPLPLHIIHLQWESDKKERRNDEDPGQGSLLSVSFIVRCESRGENNKKEHFSPLTHTEVTSCLREAGSRKIGVKDSSFFFSFFIVVSLVSSLPYLVSLSVGSEKPSPLPVAASLIPLCAIPHVVSSFSQTSHFAIQVSVVSSCSFLFLLFFSCGSWLADSGRHSIRSCSHRASCRPECASIVNEWQSHREREREAKNNVICLQDMVSGQQKALGKRGSRQKVVCSSGGKKGNSHEENWSYSELYVRPCLMSLSCDVSLSFSFSCHSE